MKTKLPIRAVVLLLASGTAVSVGVACGSNSSTGATAGSGGSGGTVIVGSVSSSTTGATGSTGSSSSGGMGGNASSSTASGAGGSCTGAAGCYACAPTTDNEYLNACNGQTCQAFDNSSARLPMLLADGGLPALP